MNLFPPTQIEEIALGIETLTPPHFILELTRQGHLDALTVRIERHPPEIDAASAVAAAEVLKLRIKTSIGTSVDVRVEDPRIPPPRSEGKYKRLYDLR